ncbi:coiled-coil alpha-helical rod protein 1-like [Zingiber officinale]|uniref:coiled-coil alpha-helical rod protein 1-like n=1 Tax=Zingiber officinale TaxID=94328 RepID=UPI001C4DD880|nr:coiled-coil alpha-helical rod protein 1-like [Zingiber officinale]
MAKEGEAEAEVVVLRWQQLHKTAQERCRSVEELEEVQWKVLEDRECQVQSKASIELELGSELDKAKESERRMLESLTFQTKQLEQTKILLEETKLELRSLQATTSLGHQGDEVAALRNELRLALAAEEKSKRAMDGLALALKEVATESSRFKVELEAARGEIERLRAGLRGAKAAAAESLVTWQAKEAGFLECVRTCEDDLADARMDRARTAQKHRVAREESAKLRDIVKQAINEASVVKEALEIARRENAQLQDALRVTKQELECAKEGELAALESVRELQSLLVSPDVIDLEPSKAKRTAKYRSENWRRRSAGGDMYGFEGSIFDSAEHSPKQRIPSEEEQDEVKAVAVGGWDSFAQRKKKRQILRRFGDLLRRSHN